MLVDVAKLDKALDRTLEAAVDHSLWPGILQDIAQATNAFGVNVLALKGIFPGGIVATESLGPALEGYFDGGWHLNEWRVRGLPLLARQGTALEQDYTTRDNFEQQAYYRAQRRFGLGRTCAVGFSGQDASMVMALHRRYDDDPYDVEDEAVFRVMRDRLVVAANMMQALSVTRLEAMSDAFEIAGLPAVFFNRSGRVTKTNAAAAKILGGDLKIVENRLVAKHHAETVLIQKRMAAVATSAWLTPADHQPITISRNDKRPLLVRIQRLGGNLADIFNSAVGVCLVEDMEPSMETDTAGVARTFGLTNKQAQIAVFLAQGRRLRDIADEMGISYETARTHLRMIFDRTSTNRQSDLVAIVARFSK
jgi:DNA-binding CsgD family transcriptional regulator/PAS domain-containing protein